MKFGILGYGEVGQAIKAFYPGALVGTKTKKLPSVDVLHVCIPWQRNFISIVKKQKYKLAIIHSSVPVGTTEKIPNAVHSPVRGIHPQLALGIRTFTKYVGGKKHKQAEKILEETGITTFGHQNSKVTELGKLLDTTYYGLCIEFHAYAERLCKKYGVPSELVMTHFNQTYNLGYKRLGMPNVVRPVLYPPKGKIGGHCILPNAALLPKMKFKYLWKYKK